ncbi:MFS transporter [Streptomyces sp. SID12501]|uniref:MFS transporter n=1 Tax=Streptomyces sp. SID12501 TaxID=2706042 RepID=A0A6B3BTN8_9ACTN|nr:MFS transporter [Streptomyces sp. SID12501]NEC87731.1 MFS transporter [Streptomyces sp. SID12501]
MNQATGTHIFKDRAFRRVFTATGVSATGDALTQAALPFAILAMNDSATAIGLVLAARALPYALLMLPAGIVGDRFSPQRILFLANAVRTVVQGLTAAILFSGHAPILLLAALQAIQGAASAFVFPASRSILPRALHKEYLQRANALISTAFSTAAILGPLLAGVLLAFTSPAFALALDAGSFLVGALLLGRIPNLPEVPGSTSGGKSGKKATDRTRRSSWRKELATGFREVVNSRWLLLGLVHAAGFQVLVVGAVAVLGPMTALDHYGGDSGWAVLLSCMSVGHLLGGMAAMRWRPANPLRSAYTVVLGTVPALLAMAAGLPLWSLVALLVLYGMTLSVGDTLWETAVQANVPLDRLSRVISFDGFVSFGLRPLGLAAIGPAAAVAGSGNTLVVMAAAAALLTVAAAVLAGRPRFSPAAPPASAHTEEPGVEEEATNSGPR